MADVRDKVKDSFYFGKARTIEENILETLFKSHVELTQKFILTFREELDDKLLTHLLLNATMAHLGFLIKKLYGVIDDKDEFVAITTMMKEHIDEYTRDIKESY